LIDSIVTYAGRVCLLFYTNKRGNNSGMNPKRLFKVFSPGVDAKKAEVESHELE
jgi:hypothetical protein